MGAKTWMLVYADTDAREALKVMPPLDREATLRLANSLFPGEKLISVGDGDLSYTCPPDDEVHIGAFAGVSIVAAREFVGIDYPSKLPERFLAAGAGRTMYLHAMHSVVDWFAFAQWNNGGLVRSLSLSPDSGILEDIGQRLPFEAPYWAGQHPAVEDEDDEYPLPFHPLSLGETALKTFFGYQLEGAVDLTLLEPESIPLIRYKRTRL
jgi:hypothetical protein